MVHCQLQDLGLFQFGRALFFVRRGHESPEFGQTGVDAVATSLLDYAPAFLAGKRVRRFRAVSGRRTTAERVGGREKKRIVNEKKKTTTFII